MQIHEYNRISHLIDYRIRSLNHSLQEYGLDPSTSSESKVSATSEVSKSVDRDRERDQQSGSSKENDSTNSDRNENLLSKSSTDSKTKTKSEHLKKEEEVQARAKQSRKKKMSPKFSDPTELARFRQQLVTSNNDIVVSLSELAYFKSQQLPSNILRAIESKETSLLEIQKSIREALSSTPNEIDRYV